jgi:UDP-3-O-[3-hydroxymyristoyl] glucosamine N-acyltransferase
VVIGKHCLVIAQSGLAGSSRLGNYVTVAAQSGVAGHVMVGDKSILGGRTGVTANLKGGEAYMGYPAQPFADEQKQKALVRRLPKMLEDLKALKKK